jgi:hypothetical protein
MMKRPTLAREKRSERKSVAEKDELHRALEEVIDRSMRAISEKIDRLITEIPLFIQTDLAASGRARRPKRGSRAACA